VAILLLLLQLTCIKMDSEDYEVGKRLSRMFRHIAVLEERVTILEEKIMEKQKRERGPNTRELLYSQSILYAAVEVLREKAGISHDEFEKLTDMRFEEMFPVDAKEDMSDKGTKAVEVVV